MMRACEILVILGTPEPHQRVLGISRYCRPSTYIDLSPTEGDWEFDVNLSCSVILSFRWESCSPMFGSLVGWSVNWLITLRLSQSSARSSTSQRSAWRGESWSSAQPQSVISHWHCPYFYWIWLDQTLYTVLVLMRFTTIKQGLVDCLTNLFPFKEDFPTI